MAIENWKWNQNNFIWNGSHCFWLPLAISSKHPSRRHAAVLVEFLAMLAVETVLNHPHCSKFFHRPWLQEWTTPKSPWDSDTVISLTMSEFNCEDLLIWPNNRTRHARPEFLQKNFAFLQSFLLYSCWQNLSLLEGERGQFQVFVDESSHGSGTHVIKLCHLSHGSPRVSPNPLSNPLNHWFRPMRGLPLCLGVWSTTSWTIR